MRPVLILAIGLLVTGAVLYVQYVREKYLAQYLFFIRFPVLLALALTLFPIAGPRLAPNMLNNIFALDDRWIAGVMFAAVLCAFAVVHTARLIWLSAPFRVQLSFDKREPDAGRAGARALNDPRHARWGAFWATLGLLAVAPLAWRLARSGDAAHPLAMIALGVAAAAAARWVGDRMASWMSPGWLVPPPGADALRKPSAPARTTKPVRVQLQELYTPPSIDDDLLRRYRGMHARALALAVLSFAVYGSAALMGGTSDGGAAVPALIYLLVFLLVLTWVLGFAAFLLDGLRVPIVGFVVALVWAASVISPSVHVYETVDRADAWPAFYPALTSRASRAGGTLVVVAASGGGITASLWTAYVLQQLAADLSVTANDFHDHVALVSAVSGGAVGAMYYIDAFHLASPTDDGRPDADDMASIVDRSADSSLSAVAWGLVFLDFNRPIFGRWLGAHDRGWALERQWDRRLDHTGTTIGSWADGVRAGWRPVPVFGATEQETGARLALTPVAMPDGGTGGVHGRDLRVVTAARLSAAFPYISPEPRPEGDDAASAGYHLADGGYYDNSGIAVALDMVEQWLASTPHPAVTKIALVEIRAAGLADRAPGVRADSLSNELTGPLETLYNVRSTSQRERSEDAINLARKGWNSAYQVRMEHFLFRLTNDQPLSWHLSHDDVALIEDHWPDGTHPAASAAMAATLGDNLASLCGLGRFLNEGRALPALIEERCPEPPGATAPGLPGPSPSLE